MTKKRVRNQRERHNRVWARDRDSRRSRSRSNSRDGDIYNNAKRISLSSVDSANLNAYRESELVEREQKESNDIESAFYNANDSYANDKRDPRSPTLVHDSDDNLAERERERSSRFNWGRLGSSTRRIARAIKPKHSSSNIASKNDYR